MLAALEPHGLVGLGLVYEGLRHPVAYSGALDEVGDFDGLPIRVPASRASVALFEALGARPVHSSDYAYDDQGGPIYAAESDFAWLAQTSLPAPSRRGASFFPKYLVLTAPQDVFERLTTAQQDVLRRAAATTVEQAVETGADEERRAAEYCEGGGSVRVASDAFRTALRARLAPVERALRQEADTRRWMEQISAIKDGLRPEPFRLPAPCAPLTGDGARLPSPPPAPMP
jgi:TRAP-type C4-dicarboxylate transport system substrate-binding protein